MKIVNGTTMISLISHHTVNQALKCNGICKNRKLQWTFKNNQRLLRICLLWTIWMIHLTSKWQILTNGKCMKIANGMRRAGRTVREELSHTLLQVCLLTLLTSMSPRLLNWYQSILLSMIGNLMKIASGMIMTYLISLLTVNQALRCNGIFKNNQSI